MDNVKRFYRQQLAEFAPSAQAVGWNDPVSQQLRFEVLSRIGDLSHQHILDAGCGLGDLYAFLQNSFEHVQYTGIDLMPEMTALAHERFPEAAFLEADARYFENQAFDYVLCSGLFAIKSSDSAASPYETIDRLFGLCKQGLAFNMLRSGEHPNDETFATFEPERIADYCRMRTRDVELIEDYLPHDFTILMRHD